MYVYLNGHLVPEKAATVSVFDRGFAYGDSLIETLKVLRGQPVFFMDHFNRLCRAMAQAGFESKLKAGDLRNHAVSLAEANEVSEGRLRIQLSRGTPLATAGVDPITELKPTLLLTTEPFTGYPEELYREGIKCVTVAANRGRYAKFKNASLFPSILARLEVAAEDAQEAVFTSGHGRVLEGSLSNIFFFIDGRLLTAGEDQPILPGVTRAKVIGIAEESGLEVIYEAPKTGELKSGEDAAFLTSSVLGVCPVREIDSLKLRMGADIVTRLVRHLGELELEDIK